MSMDGCQLRLQRGASLIFNHRRFSYQDMRRSIAQIIDTLLEGRTESPIAIVMERSEAMVCAMLACLEGEITYIIIDPAWPQARIEHILKECSVEIAIVQKRFVEKLSCRAVFIEDIQSRTVKTAPLKNKNPSRLAYILYTSGSTGNPKGVMVTRANLTAFIDNIPQSISFKDVQQVASLSTAIFDVFFLESIVPLFLGLTVVLGTEDECKNPRMMVQLLTEHSVDLVQMTPSKMSMLQAIDPRFQCLNAVKRILLGGEQLPLQLLRDLQNFTQATVYNLYGPTETTIWSTVSDLTGQSTVDIGTPLKQTELYLIDENFRLITDDRAGEICIAGSGLADGYYNNPQTTAEAFIPLPELPGVRVYRTGDLGRHNGRGRFEWLGRRDNQVKIRGHRIELEGLESVMDACPDILKSVALVHSNGGVDQLGLIYFDCGAEPAENAVKRYARRELPKYMLPNFYIRGEKIFYTDNGKLDRRRTVEHHIRQLGTKSNGGQKTDADSEIVMRIVGDYLLKQEVDMQSRLADTGMDSVTFIKIIASLEEQFDFEFENEVLSLKAFEKVSDLIDYVESHKSDRVKELKP